MCFVFVYYFLFHSYSFLKRCSTSIHSRGSLENHTRFQTNGQSVCTRFSAKKAQKPYPLGQHIPIWFMALLSTDFLTY